MVGDQAAEIARFQKLCDYLLTQINSYDFDTGSLTQSLIIAMFLNSFANSRRSTPKPSSRLSKDPSPLVPARAIRKIQIPDLPMKDGMAVVNPP